MVVRFPFVKDFRNTDFLCKSLSRFQSVSNSPGATIDIAIWSTTEMGLAVTAGSLATLRPLLRILTHRLGLSSTGPSNLESHPVSGRGKSTASGPFSLTTFIRGEDNGIQIVDEESSGAYRSQTESRANESEEELTGKERAIKITTTIKQEENRI